MAPRRHGGGVRRRPLLEAKRTSIAGTAQSQARQASYDRNAPNKDENRALNQTAIDEAQARYAAAKAKG